MQQGLAAWPTLGAAYAPLTDQQLQDRARSSVSAQIDPLIGEITRAIQARAQAGQSAIGGYTTQLADRLRPLAGQTEQSYQGGVQGLEGLQAALADRLARAGTDAAAATSGSLAAAAQNTDPALRAASFGSGASAAGLAAGNADLNALRTQGLAATDYARSLPGIAGLAGIRQSGMFQGQTAGELADQVGQVTSQVPGLVSNVLGDLRSTELSKAGARTQNQQGRLDYGQKLREFYTGAAMDKKKLAADERTNRIATILSLGVDPNTGLLTPAAAQALGKIAGVNPQVLAGTDAATATKIINANKPAAPKIIGSSSSGYYTVDATGNAIPLPGGPKPTSTPPKNGGKSDSEQRQAYDGAVSIAEKSQGETVLGKRVGGDTFLKAYNKVLSYLTGLKYQTNDAKRLALQAMGAAGWTMPGQVDVSP